MGRGASSLISLVSALLSTGRQPLCRAGRPSCDLGFLLVSPLELWLCFRPSAPAVSDLSSCDSRLCFDSKLALFGAFWGVVTSSGRHCPTPSPCAGWPASCAPSWGKIPFLSFVESSMTRVESYPTTGPKIPSVIGSLFCPSLQPLACTSHCSSPIFSSPPATWGSPSAAWHSSFAICPLSSAIRHLSSAFSASPFPIPKSAIRNFRNSSSVRISSRCRADWYRRCRSKPGLQSSAARSYRSSASSASISSCSASNSSSRPTCRSMTEPMRISAAVSSLGAGAISR